MLSLKEKILQLKDKGLSQKSIASVLKCSTGTVSYHCNPLVKKKIIDKKRNKRKLNKLPKEKHPLIKKEIDVIVKDVCWKHAEAFINSKLIEKGYSTFLPFNDGNEIDIIAEKDKKLIKIQIKSVKPNKNFLKLNLTRNSINYKKNISKPYENIDWFLIYDGNNIYKIEEDVSSVVLRYKVPTTNQIDNIRMASDYLF